MHILKRHLLFARILCAGLVFGFSIAGGICREYSAEFEAKIDSLAVAAYQTAIAEFPCKVDVKGKPGLIRWQDIEKCLNDAEERIDWEKLFQELEVLRQQEGVSRTELTEVVESALAAHAIPYSQVFKVKKKDAWLPLSNTVLKFLPEESLKDLPVYDSRQKREIGTFFASFPYEKSGGLSAADTYTLYLFQYKDLEGDLQAPALGNRLLLDSFGVPWQKAQDRIGFRLNTQKLNFKY